MRKELLIPEYTHLALLTLQQLREEKSPLVQGLHGYTNDDVAHNICCLLQDRTSLMNKVLFHEQTLCKELYLLFPFYGGRPLVIPDDYTERVNLLATSTNSLRLAQDIEQRTGLLYSTSKGYRRWCDWLGTPMRDEELLLLSKEKTEEKAQMHWFAHELREFFPASAYKKAYMHLHTRVVKADYFITNLLIVYDAAFRRYPLLNDDIDDSDISDVDPEDARILGELLHGDTDVDIEDYLDDTDG